MAVLAARANGNLTSAATWALINAASYSVSEASNTALTTSFVVSATFTPGAVTIDGIGVKLAFRNASPTGTMDVELRQGGVTVAGTNVQINVADLVSASTNLSGGGGEGGWVFFKFAAPVLLLAATLYTVAAKTSSAGQVNLWRTSTGGDWSRYLRTTTTQAPAAGDDMIIVGEKTAAGAMTTRTVDMDSTAATDYGANANLLAAPSLAICAGGTLQSLTTASTNFLLRISGRTVVYSGGLFTMGTLASPIPRSSTAWLEQDNTVNGGSGMEVRNGGTFYHYGESRSAGNNSDICRLTSNAAVNATTLNVDTDTGWLDNDEVMIFTTTTLTAQTERGTLNGAAGASTLTVDGFAGVGGGLAFAHTVLNLVAAEIILLSRNTGVRSTNSSFFGYVKIWDNATFSGAWFRYTYMGYSGQAGLTVNTSNSVTLSYISMDQSGLDSFSIGPTGNPAYLLEHFAILGSTSGTGNNFVIGGNSGNNINVDSLYVARCGLTGSVNLNNTGGTFSNIIVVSSGAYGVTLNPRTSGSLTNVMCRACGLYGIRFSNGHYTSFVASDLYAIRNFGSGIQFTTYSFQIPIDNVYAVGNGGSSGIESSSSPQLIINNLVLGGETGFGQNRGSIWNGGLLVVNGCSSGVSPYTAHGFGMAHTDVSGQQVYNDVTMTDVSASWLSNRSNWTRLGYIAFMRLGGVAGAHISYLSMGNREPDYSIFYSTGPSEKLSPVSATTSLYSQARQVLVNSGETKTVTVAVRKDAAYNGNAPRFIQAGNAAIGLAPQVVLDTLTVGAGSWEILTGVVGPVTDDGVFEVYVDCDGTAGYINVDEWGAS